MNLPYDVDGGTLLALVLCAVALFAFAKWAAKISAANQPRLPHEPTVEFPFTQASLFQPTSELVPRDAFFPADSALGPIRIVKFYFSKFDLVRGPADPRVFYDELFVELYDTDSGHRWTQSYGVGTPDGLAEILKEKSWFYLYTNALLVVQRYDLDRIRKAVLARIAEENELFKSANRAQEEEAL